MNESPHSVQPARMTPLAQPAARPLSPHLKLVRGEIVVIAIAIATLLALGVAAVAVWESRGFLEGTGLAALFAAAVGTATLLGVSLSLSQAFRLRARALREAAVEIGLGDLSMRAPSEPLDDLGALGQSLNDMADRIARVLQAQRDLLSGISHELRSPLARIEVALELIHTELESARARAPEGRDRRNQLGEDLLAEMHEEVHLLESHIGRLLEAQRVGMERVLVHRTEVNLDALVQMVLRRERHRLERAGFQFELALDSKGAIILGDGNALDRVVSTLIENILRYAATDTWEHDKPCRPKLHIETEHDSSGVVLRVMDRGPGLTAEECSRVFEAFYRSPSARALIADGSGLGLFLVKRTVEAHGGRVRAIQRQGGGLCIEIRLPVAGKAQLGETPKVRAAK